MPYGELKINTYDAYQTWGLSLSDGAKAVLMTPPPQKSRVSNATRRTHGVTVVSTPERVDKREISLQMHISNGNGKDSINHNYKTFCEVLKAGKVFLEYSGLPDTCFRFYYISCSNFVINGSLMKFTLKLEEPNPTDRGIITPSE